MMGPCLALPWALSSSFLILGGNPQT
jgi:hypothetical protein